MNSFLTLFILCIYVGLDQTFSVFVLVHNTNSISPPCSITTFEFNYLYMNCSRSMPGLCVLSGNPSTRYATNVRIWALFPYLLNINFYWQIPFIHIHYDFKCCSS